MYNYLSIFVRFATIFMEDASRNRPYSSPEVIHRAGDKSPHSQSF
jgi:hypothetical protein